MWYKFNYPVERETIVVSYYSSSKENLFRTTLSFNTCLTMLNRNSKFWQYVLFSVRK